MVPIAETVGSEAQIIMYDPCQVTDCHEEAKFTRRFGWQISGATFLQIVLNLCPQHTLAVDLLKGKTLPVTAILL